MGARYQVVGECAHVVVTDHTGVAATTLLYKGAFLPDEVDKDRLKHLLDTGLVAEVKDGEEIAPNASVDQDPTVGIPPLAPAGDGQGDGSDAGDGGEKKSEPSAEEQEAERKRAEARAKLPADGSAPDGRAADEVWVEYAVSKGMDRAEAAKAGKAEIRKALAGGKG